MTPRNPCRACIWGRPYAWGLLGSQRLQDQDALIVCPGVSGCVWWRGHTCATGAEPLVTALRCSGCKAEGSEV